MCPKCERMCPKQKHNVWLILICLQRYTAIHCMSWMCNAYLSFHIYCIFYAFNSLLPKEALMASCYYVVILWQCSPNITY
jgi:hypothetical protein